MSQLIQNKKELSRVCESAEGVFVLFYASWCPFCIRFLPVYEERAGRREQSFFRFPLDGNEPVFEAFAVNVYPTVIFFKGGKPVRRLDGKAGAGLDHTELDGLIEVCREVSG